MSKPKQNHTLTGVALEPAVVAYLDDLAIRMRSSRSWVINTVVYEYAKLMENKNLMPLSAALNPPQSKEAVIK